MTQDRPAKNRNHGVLGNIGGALKSAAIIAGDYAREHPAHTWQELAPSLGAAATGLAGGAINPALDETLQKEIDVQGARARQQWPAHQGARRACASDKCLGDLRGSAPRA
jgi:outer membrane lipoprotein SlyB